MQIMVNPLTERDIRQTLELVEQNKRALPQAFLEAANEFQSELAGARSTAEANDAVLEFLEASKRVRHDLGPAYGWRIKEIEDFLLEQPNVLNPSVS